MMPSELLQPLRGLGVELSMNGDKLHVEAPEGVLTPELRKEIREHKQELLELLSREVCVFTTGPWGERMPVIIVNGVSPLDYRFDTDKKKWVIDPDWWRSIPKRGGKHDEA